MKIMLKDIMVKQLKRNNDERGTFTEIFRTDWKELFDTDKPVQANFSMTYPGTVRAWHRHKRGQTDYFTVLQGALKICAYDEKTRELTEIISADNDVQIVRIPGHYWHGFKAIGTKTALLVYFTTRHYDYENPDEERKLFNDPHVIPKTVNGNKKDPRTGKPWDWNLAPHK